MKRGLCACAGVAAKVTAATSASAKADNLII
jgi:hypothetical protein